MRNQGEGRILLTSRWPAVIPNGGIPNWDSASPYAALLGEQNSSTRGLAHDHVLAGEARTQAHNTRHRGVQGRLALDQDRLAISGNPEHIKSGLEKGRQVPVFG